MWREIGERTVNVKHFPQRVIREYKLKKKISDDERDRLDFFCFYFLEKICSAPEMVVDRQNSHILLYFLAKFFFSIILI